MEQYLIAGAAILLSVGAIHETNQCNYKPAALLLFGAVLLGFGCL